MTVVRPSGSSLRLRASRRGDRWTVSRRLVKGERAFVAAGDVVDAFGNVNGEQSRTVNGRG